MPQEPTPNSDGKNEPRAKMLVQKYQRLKGERQNWETYWQSLHDYFFIESTDVSVSYMPGNELTIDNLYDSTTLESIDVLASGFMNYLTPPTSKWFNLTPKNPKFKANKKIHTFLDDCASEVNYTLNRSNYYQQNYNNYKGSGVYGTSIMYEEEDVENYANFTSLPIKNCVIVEDSKGRVCEYFIEFEYTADQAAQRWGEENLSTNMREELRKNQANYAGGGTNTKFLFLLYIARRWNGLVGKNDKKNMPIEAVWIDEREKVTMEEGGYNEFPAFCHRWDKRPFLQWGFSPSMKTLPFARMLNAIAKTNLRMMMKHTDPPIAIPDDAFILPFDMNPRGYNIYSKSVMDKGANDIFAFGNYGNPQVGMQAVEYYTMKVKSMMYNDVFLAFDGITKQMNNPEVMERINEKMSMLAPAVGRYVSEMINPTIMRTLGILSRRGKLPRPPDEFLMNPEYEIDCVSQLAQAQKRSELNALVTGLSMVQNMSQVAPQVMDKVDPDKVVDEIWNITGAPDRVLRDDTEVFKLRQVRGQQAQHQQQIQMAEQIGSAIQKGSDADKKQAEGKKALASVGK